MRIGFGIDFHQLTEGRDLWIGGVKIPHHKGALGHSDADVLLHAICDALLGAAALGDIGKFFPDTDAKFRGIDSRMLLREVVARVAQAGWKPSNVDLTLIAQTPKVAKHVPAMVERLAADLGLDGGAVNVKATTNEALDSVGRKEGIAAHAVVLVVRA